MRPSKSSAGCGHTSRWTHWRRQAGAAGSTWHRRRPGETTTVRGASRFAARGRRAVHRWWRRMVSIDFKGSTVATKRTQLLMVLILAGAAAALLGYARLDKARDAAERSAVDLATCRQQLTDLAGWRG